MKHSLRVKWKFYQTESLWAVSVHHPYCHLRAHQANCAREKPTHGIKLWRTHTLLVVSVHTLEPVRSRGSPHVRRQASPSRDASLFVVIQ
jgi:hypothetical protein